MSDIKQSISSWLGKTFPGQDVRVQIQTSKIGDEYKGIDYGQWLWDEASKSHIHISSKEYKFYLGSDAKNVETIARNIWKNLDSR